MNANEDSVDTSDYQNRKKLYSCSIFDRGWQFVMATEQFVVIWDGTSNGWMIIIDVVVVLVLQGGKFPNFNLSKSPRSLDYMVSFYLIQVGLVESRVILPYTYTCFICTSNAWMWLLDTEYFRTNTLESSKSNWVPNKQPNLTLHIFKETTMYTQSVVDVDKDYRMIIRHSRWWILISIIGTYDSPCYR